MTHNHHQFGSALVYILIAVILFAAVVFAFTRGQNTASSKMDERSARITATSILSYAQSIKSGVDSVSANGCSESEISFENTSDASYTFATRTECKIFNRGGGKKRWQDFPTAAGTTSIGFTGGRYNRYNFTATSLVKELDTTTDINTSSSDLALVIAVNPQTCTALNMILKGEKTRSFTGLNTDQTMITGTSSFTGTFTATGANLINNYCVLGTDFGVFTYVLLGR